MDNQNLIKAITDLKQSVDELTLIIKNNLAPEFRTEEENNLAENIQKLVELLEEKK